MASFCLSSPARIRSPDDHWVPIEICSNHVLAAPSLRTKQKSDHSPWWRPDAAGDHVLVDVLTGWCQVVPRWIKCDPTCLWTTRTGDNDVDCNRWPPPPNNHRLSLNSLSQDFKRVVVGRLCDVLRAEHRAVQVTSWRDSKEFPAHCATYLDMDDACIRNPYATHSVFTKAPPPNAHDSLSVCLPFGIRCTAHGCRPNQHRQLYLVDTLHPRDGLGLHRQTNFPKPYTQGMLTRAGTSQCMARKANYPMGPKRKAHPGYPDIHCRTSDGSTVASLHPAMECLQPQSSTKTTVHARRKYGASRSVLGDVCSSTNAR